jgi:hypothetical protein
VLPAPGLPPAQSLASPQSYKQTCADFPLASCHPPPPRFLTLSSSSPTTNLPPSLARNLPPPVHISLHIHVWIILSTLAPVGEERPHLQHRAHAAHRLQPPHPDPAPRAVAGAAPHGPTGEKAAGYEGLGNERERAGGSRISVSDGARRVSSPPLSSLSPTIPPSLLSPPSPNPSPNPAVAALSSLSCLSLAHRQTGHHACLVERGPLPPRRRRRCLHLHECRLD